MAGTHTRWVRPEEIADDPERIAIREALAFGKALYDVRTAQPTIPLPRRLAAALNADVRLTSGHDLGSVWFETHAA
jgi:hypothetical protein